MSKNKGSVVFGNDSEECIGSDHGLTPGYMEGYRKGYEQALQWRGPDTLPQADGIEAILWPRARAKIPYHFRISSSGHLRPIFTHTILNVGLPTLAVVLPQIDPICPKSEREFCEGIFARTLTTDKGFTDLSAHCFLNDGAWYWMDSHEIIKRQDFIMGWQPWPEPPTQ